MDAPYKTTFVSKNFNMDEFENVVELAKGEFGAVFRATYPCYPEVAVKRLKTTAEQRKELSNFVKYTYHTNIVKCFGEVQDFDGQYIGIVLEYMDCGSLSSVIHGDTRYTVPTAFNWMVQACNGLSYLHGEKVVHRDIKPCNMLLSHNRTVLKLCDLGLTKIRSKMNTTWGGTPCFMAPEIYQELEQSYAVDVYALAISFWELRTRRRAFDHVKDDSLLRLRDMICKENCRPQITFRDRHLADLFTRMWQADPKSRPTMNEVSSKVKEMKVNHRNSTTPVLKPNKGQAESSQNKLSTAVSKMSIDDSSISSSSSSSSGSGSSSKNKTKAIDEWITYSQEAKTCLADLNLHGSVEKVNAQISNVSKEVSNISRKQKLESVDESVKEVKSRLQIILDMIRDTLKVYPGLKILIGFEEKTKKLSASVDEQATARKLTIASKSK